MHVHIAHNGKRRHQRRRKSYFSLIEMLADWKAASLRHANGDIFESLRINKERFQISDQLIEILENTIREMVWTSAELNK